MESPREKLTDDRCQVMAKAHIVFGLGELIIKNLLFFYYFFLIKIFNIGKE
jgi:hypothetical protein